MKNTQLIAVRESLTAKGLTPAEGTVGQVFIVQEPYFVWPFGNSFHRLDPVGAYPASLRSSSKLPSSASTPGVHSRAATKAGATASRPAPGQSVCAICDGRGYPVPLGVLP
jgi:hypothetical protein